MEPKDFERVVREHKDRIYNYAALLLRDATEAQDVAQEALVRLWQHRQAIAEDGAPFWLRRTAYHLCIDRLRRCRSRREIDVESSGLPSADDPSRAAQGGELGTLILRSLERLPVRDRSVVLLREVEGLAYADIARILDVPIGTLKARLHRARERLRLELLRAGVVP
jgi:RNA polymerase sigma-70 factor (ECF subfamily)